MFAERSNTADNLTKELAVRCISATDSNISQIGTYYSSWSRNMSKSPKSRSSCRWWNIQRIAQNSHCIHLCPSN